MCNHSFFDYFGGQFDLGLSESKSWVTTCAPSVLSHFAGHGEYSSLEVANTPSIEREVVVWFVVTEGFLPEAPVSVVARVIGEFEWRVTDLLHIQLPWFNNNPYVLVAPSKAVGFLAVIEMTSIQDYYCTVV